MEDVYNLYETYHESKIIHISSSNLHVFFMQMETSRVFKEILLLAQEYNIYDFYVIDTHYELRILNKNREIGKTNVYKCVQFYIDFRSKELLN